MAGPVGEGAVEAEPVAEDDVAGRDGGAEVAGELADELHQLVGVDRHGVNPFQRWMLGARQHRSRALQPACNGGTDAVARAGPATGRRSREAAVRAREPDRVGVRRPRRRPRPLRGLRRRPGPDRVHAGRHDRGRPDVEGPGRLPGAAPPGRGHRPARERPQRPPDRAGALHRPARRGRPARGHGRRRHRPGAAGRALRQRVVRAAGRGTAPRPRRRRRGDRARAPSTGRRGTTAASTPPPTGAPTSTDPQGWQLYNEDVWRRDWPSFPRWFFSQICNDPHSRRSTRTSSTGPARPPAR